MVLPSNGNVKTKLSKADPNLGQRIANLKANLKPAYKPADIANKTSHNQKEYYDRQVKHRSFEVGEFLSL